MNYKKGFIIPLIIAIVAVLTVGGGLYFYNTSNVKNCAGLDDMDRALCEANNKGKTLGIDGFRTDLNATSTTADATAGWKTYTNTQYGFEVKYPDGHEFIVGKGNGNILFGVLYATGNDVGEEPARIEIRSSSYDARQQMGVNIKYRDVSRFDNYAVTDIESENLIHFVLNGRDVYAGCINYGNNPKTINFCNEVLSTFKFTTPTNQTTLQLWPDAKSFDLTNKTFEAKGIGKDTQTTKNIKVYTNNLTKFSSKNTSTSMNSFQDMYSMLKNWVGPEWWFNVTGTYQKDGSFLASEISMGGQ